VWRPWQERPGGGLGGVQVNRSACTANRGENYQNRIPVPRVPILFGFASPDLASSGFPTLAIAAVG